MRGKMAEVRRRIIEEGLTIEIASKEAYLENANAELGSFSESLMWLGVNT